MGGLDRLFRGERPSPLAYPCRVYTRHAPPPRFSTHENERRQLFARFFFARVSRVVVELEGEDAGSAPRHRQYAKFPRGTFTRALAAGVPITVLPTLVRIALHTSGNPDGNHVRTSVIAARVGVTPRTIQRHVRLLEGQPAPKKRDNVSAGPSTEATPPARPRARRPERPLAAEPVRGFKVVRKRIEGNRANSHPNQYHTEQVARGATGTLVFAELTELPAWGGASAAQQGILLYMVEMLGPTTSSTTYQKIADACGRSRSCVRQAIYYWRAAGVLQVEVQELPRMGNVGNHFTLRVAGDWVKPGEPLSADQQRQRALASVIRWSGLRLAALAMDDAEFPWWAKVGAAVEDRDKKVAREAAEKIERMLADYLNGAAREVECPYKGSGSTRAIRAALPYVWERRDAFDREEAERRSQKPPEMVEDRAWGTPWEGDWTPSAFSAQPDIVTFEPANWSAVCAAMNAGAVDSGGEALSPHFLAQLRPIGVQAGALVVVVSNPSFGDAFALEHAAHLCAALGGRIALRLSSYQDQLDGELAHARLVGEWKERIDLAERRARAVEAQIAALPTLPRSSPGMPTWKPNTERQGVRAAAVTDARAARAAVEDVRAALAAAGHTSSNGWARQKRPDWAAVEAQAGRALDLATSAESLAAEAVALGGTPGGFSPLAPPPGAPQGGR